MANPALELAAILEEWTVERGKSIHQARGNNANASSVKLWDEIVRGVRCLADIDRILATLVERGEDINDFKTTMPAWYAAVFLPDNAWNQPHNNGLKIISATDLATLRMFGRYIASEGLTGSLPAPSLAAIIDALSDIEDACQALDVGDLSRHKLLWHVRQAKEFAADIDRFGEAVVVHVAVEVATAAARFANESDVDPESGGRLRKAAASIMINAAGSAVGGGMVAIAPHVVAAIQAVAP